MMTRKTQTHAWIVFAGAGLVSVGLFLAQHVQAAADAAKASPNDAATEAAQDRVSDMARDKARDTKRREARDASREESPQQAAAILKQTFAQLLLREDTETDRKTYGAPLMRGEKSVRSIVALIAASPEFKQKWGLKDAMLSTASQEKVIDNLYCALMGRHSTSARQAQDDAAAGGWDRLANNIINSQEYATLFGEQGVPHPSLNQQESSGCPQVG
jgi:uncharacterized membrane protein YcjF (UPF0283 family)